MVFCSFYFLGDKESDRCFLNSVTTGRTDLKTVDLDKAVADVGKYRPKLS